MQKKHMERCLFALIVLLIFALTILGLQNKYILSRRKRGEVIEEAIDYFVVKSVIFTNNTAIFSI